MTTEVTISSKKPNHNPFRVRVIAVNQALFNQALEDAIVALVQKKGVHCVTTSTHVLNEGESLPQHGAFVHDHCVIVIDEVRPE